MNAYCDIIAQPRPVSRRHPQMRCADRAKQFMPFAALRGFDDAIGERETLYEPFRTLSEEQRDRLDRQLLELRERLLTGERPVITVTCFVPAPRQLSPSLRQGQYCAFTGPARKMDPESGTLRIGDRRFDMEEIVGMEEAQPPA